MSRGIRPILLLLLLGACFFKPVYDPKALVYRIGGEPDTLNPLTGTDSFESFINSFIYDTLIDRDPDTFDHIPKMAWRWEVSADKLNYTFYLRKDIFWHDGKAFTADDVIYSYQTLMDEKIPASHLRNYYQDVQDLSKLDDYTIRFKYKTPYFRALEMLGGMPILPKHIWQNGKDFVSHPASRAPIGNGPFRFKEWKSGQYIILERNKDYWDQKHIPEIEEILLKIVADQTVTLQMFKKGDLDATSISAIQWVRSVDQTKFKEKFQAFQYNQPGYRYIGYNANRELFQDPKVRWALGHLVNQKDLLDKLEFGLGLITTGPFWPQGLGYRNDLKPIGYNPDRAKVLLKEAGWEDHDGDGILDKDGNKFSFKFMIPASSDFNTKLATIFKKDLANVGIEMEVVQIEWSVFLGRLHKRDFDVTALGWSGTFDPDPFQIWHSSMRKDGSNFVNFNHKEADNLIERVRRTFDQKQRDQLLKRIHTIIYNEQPYTFLFSPSSLNVVSKRVGNVKVHKAGMDPKEWVLSP